VLTEINYLYLDVLTPIRGSHLEIPARVNELDTKMLTYLDNPHIQDWIRTSTFANNPPCSLRASTNDLDFNVFPIVCEQKRASRACPHPHELFSP
jgi:hypothetical protein